MIQRPNEYHKEFEPKPNQYKRITDVQPRLTDTGKDQYKDKRDETGKPAGDSNIQEDNENPFLIVELTKEEENG